MRQEVLGDQRVVALVPTVKEKIGAGVDAQYEAGCQDGKDRLAVVAAAMSEPGCMEQEGGESDRGDSPG